MESPQDRERLSEALIRANSARYLAPDHVREQIPMALVVLGRWSPSDRALSVAELESRLDGLLGQPSTRLAVYGSLRPGGEHFGLVAELRGTWRRGLVRGRIEQPGAEPGQRWPMLVLDEAGGEVEVDVLDSAALPERWPALDEFEGPGYVRRLAIVDLGSRLSVANLFERDFAYWRARRAP